MRFLGQSLFLACGLALIGLVPPALAHQSGLSTARIIQSPDRSVQIALELKIGDLERAAGVDFGSGVTADSLAAAQPRLEAYVESHLALTGAGGKACTPAWDSAAADGDGVRMVTRWTCAGVDTPLLYKSSVLMDTDAAARQIVLLGEGDDAPQQILDSHSDTLTLGASPPTIWRVIASYLWAGVEHIATGYDHMAFLLAVVLWGRKLWPLAKLVTAFTVSHSITLSLSALGILTMPETITEPAIAGTIIYVAVENFYSRDIDRRWVDTLLFGLIHGFGFASALREVGLPRHAVIPALASFNIGVEIGQIAVIAVALPLLRIADRALQAGPRLVGRNAGLVYGVSGVIAVLGGWWFLARTVFGGAA